MPREGDIVLIGRKFAFKSHVMQFLCSLFPQNTPINRAGHQLLLELQPPGTLLM